MLNCVLKLAPPILIRYSPSGPLIMFHRVLDGFANARKGAFWIVLSNGHGGAEVTKTILGIRFII